MFYKIDEICVVVGVLVTADHRDMALNQLNVFISWLETILGVWDPNAVPNFSHSFKAQTPILG